MTTATAAKTNQEAFLAIAKTIVSEAVKNGSNMSRLRALRGYMREVLDLATKDNCDSLKAQLVGEMFSTHDEAAAAIIAFAKEKVKFVGNDCGLAMVAIEKENGIYSPTAEIWVHVAKKLTENKIKDKDYGDLWRQLRGELRSVADKANTQMNNILKENKVKDKPTGKKGGKGKGKGKGDPAPAPVVSTETTPVTPDNVVTAVCKLDATKQLETLKLLVESMLIGGVKAGDIADLVEGILVQLPATV